MAIRQPLAQRIVLAFRLLALVVSGMFSLTVVVLVLQIEDAIISESMGHQIGLVIKSLEEKGHPPELDGETRFYAPGLTEAPPAEFFPLNDGLTEVIDGDDAYHVFRRTEADQTYVLVRNQDEFEARERTLYAAVLSGFIASMLLAWLVGHFTAARVLNPVTDLARRVRLREQRLDAEPRLAPDYPDDEVGQLAVAFDTAMGDLQRTLEREQLFTSDVSHELRTPLMIIASSSELLATRSLGMRERELVARIQSAANEMSELVQTFMALARTQADRADTRGGGERGDWSEMTKLVTVAQEQAQRWGHLATEKGLAFELSIESESAIACNPIFLRTVIGNLLRNALHHTDQGSVRLILDAHGFVVEDTGSGIPEHLKDTMFQPFVQGHGARGEGLGLGLSLVRRICEANGWAITLENRPGGGIRADVRLNRPPSF